MTSANFRQVFSITSVNAIILPITNSLHGEYFFTRPDENCVCGSQFPRVLIMALSNCFFFDASNINCMDCFLYAISPKSSLNTLCIENFEIPSSLIVLCNPSRILLHPLLDFFYLFFPVWIFRGRPGTCLLEILPVWL